MNRHALHLDQWPPTDRLLWNNLFHAGDVFDDGGPGAHWAATTKANTRKACGYWLHWLSQHDDACLNDAPASRVTRDRLQGYIKSLADTAALTRFVYILDLLRFLQAVYPSHNWDWLKRTKNRLWKRALPQRDKAAIIQNASVLYQLGIALMESAPDAYCPRNPLQSAVQFRNGLIIALLAARPIRLKNLQSIIIAHHLTKVDDVYWLHFEDTEVKNQKAISAPLPQDLCHYMETYLTAHRPKLLQGASGEHLWVSRFGGQLSSNSIRHQVKRHTEAAFGAAISPHLFRDCAATSIAIHDPEHVHYTAQILGHRTLQTAERYYNQARSLEASRAHQAHIMARRQKAAAQRER